tara:strand:- start:210 stop:389 length:180 start_codon:yes stop_codon:yes gene_type:complete
MVELEPEDYNVILSWFEGTFGKRALTEMPLEHKRTFWKLTFLAEDKMKELQETKVHEED